MKVTRIQPLEAVQFTEQPFLPPGVVKSPKGGWEVVIDEAWLGYIEPGGWIVYTLPHATVCLTHEVFRANWQEVKP